jgi:hypothetical protein
MIFVNKPFLYKVFLTILVKSSFQKNSFKSSPQNVLRNILSEYFLSINLFSIVFSHKLLVTKFFPKNFLAKFPTECSPKHFHLFFRKVFTQTFLDQNKFCMKSLLYKFCIENHYMYVWRGTRSGSQVTTPENRPSGLQQASRRRTWTGRGPPPVDRPHGRRRAGARKFDVPLLISAVLFYNTLQRFL